jgi:hypothetical protein
LAFFQFKQRLLTLLWTSDQLFSHSLESSIMSFSRFSWPSAVLLSLCMTSDAWVLRKATSKKAENVPQIELRNEAQNVHANKRQITTLSCPDDRFQQLLDSNPDGRVQTFCNDWLGVPAATTTVEYTPTM